MKKLIIEIPEPGDGTSFDVVDEDGKRCGGLCWGEMVEQVTILTIPPGRVGNGYRMQTAEEWQREHDERINKTTTTQENTK